MFPVPMGDHSSITNIRARFTPNLDPDFQPLSLVLRQARKEISEGTPAVELTILLERLPGDRSVHRLTVPAPASDDSGEVLRLVERVFKFLLWQQGASRVGVHSSCGSDRLAKRLAKIYSTDGNRAFDAYKADTLRRLEEEQHNFEAFLERLREAKDKAEFDQFMDERAKRDETATNA